MISLKDMLLVNSASNCRILRQNSPYFLNVPRICNVFLSTIYVCVHACCFFFFFFFFNFYFVFFCLCLFFFFFFFFFSILMFAVSIFLLVSLFNSCYCWDKCCIDITAMVYNYVPFAALSFGVFFFLFCFVLFCLVLVWLGRKLKKIISKLHSLVIIFIWQY